MKLFCFSYAGGAAEFYSGLGKELSKTGQIEVLPIDYPGHGRRVREPLRRSIAKLAEEMLTQIEAQMQPQLQTDIQMQPQSQTEIQMQPQSQTDTQIQVQSQTEMQMQLQPQPYALMGYSMGSIVVYEVLRRLTAEQKRLPEHVFLAAHEPLLRPEFAALAKEERTERIRRAVSMFGGVPDKLMNNDTFWRIYMPVYEADFGMIWSYDFAQMQYTASVPATFFYASQDIADESMRLWDRFFTGTNSYHSFSGNHFFLREHEEQIAALIAEQLGSAEETEVTGRRTRERTE